MKYFSTNYQLQLLAFLFSLTSFLLISNPLFSQETTRVYRQYATQKVHQRLLKGNQENKGNKKNVEKKIARFTRSSKKVTIPIVFHIIYSNSQNSVSEEQALSQIEALNRDFSNSGNVVDNPANELEGFAALATDTEIQFCLAGETPNNKVTTGINYYEVQNKIWGDDDAIKDKKQDGVEPWKTDDYLNVWVASLADSVSGYAQLPGGPNGTDGIVIDYRFFGIGGTSIIPYNEGKTLTHLVGNYFGLHDLWSENNYCSDDYVQDTPIHNSRHYGCPDYKQISLCSGFPVEMTMNFMDNTDDACQNMFTVGQKRRMQAVLGKGGPRAKLVENKVPCADISSILENLAIQSSIKTTATLNPLGVSMSVYPNPAKSTINIQIDSKKEGVGTLQGVDIFGRILFSKHQLWNEGTNVLSINSDTWESGTYFFQLKINDENDEIRLVKVVVSK